MSGMNTSKRMDPRELTINNEEHPDWVSGTEQPPRVGDKVLCTAGMAEVIKVRGKTGDGTRLLELKLVTGDAPPFFAACSNILVQPA